jgi:hypothetical protein
MDTVWWEYRLGRWRAPETGRSTKMRRRIAVLAAAVTLAASGAGASVAAASAPPNPVYGTSGACNMVNPNAQFGMLTKAVQGGPGLAGMFTAIFNTTGVQEGACPILGGP